MLERAAGCLENAGQRLLRDSNGAIRSRRSLPPRFWRYSAAERDHPLWYLLFLQASNQRPSRTVGAARSSSPTTIDDGYRPILEFLYPPQAQKFAASWLVRPGKRAVTRKKRRGIPELARSYTSEAGTIYSGVETEPSSGSPSGGTGQDVEERKVADLLKFLAAKGPRDHDQAWDLYMGCKDDPLLNKRALAYFSDAERPLDWSRAKRLFDAIPVVYRSAEDYLHIMRPLLLSEDASDIEEICQEAMTTEAGTACWGVAFTSFVNNTQWERALRLWKTRPAGLENDRSHPAWSYIDMSPHLPDRIIVLLEFLEEQGSSYMDDPAPAELVHFLVNYALSTLEIMKEITTETILLLTRRLKQLDLLRADYFLTAIETLRSAGVRSTVIKSMVVYRNFRWHMANEVPSTRLLQQLLETLASLEITHGVQYILDEYTLYHGKPSLEAYKLALIAYSRAADVDNVRRVFENLMRDHGKPKSRRLLTPLLYAHAIMGNVEETRREFRRIKEEFNLEPNTVCWNILLTAYANAEDLSGAFTTFEQMLEEGVEPDSHSFGVLMGLCANRGDIDAVRHLFAVAQERNVQLTTPLVDPIVEALCNNQNLADAEKVAEASLSMDLKGSRVRMWNILLWNYAFRADLDSMSRIQSRMQAAGVEPDGMTYAALMLSLVMIGRPHSARRILRTLHRSRRIHATEFHYALVLYGYVRARNFEMVDIVYREISERFHQPGFSTRLLMLKSYLQRDLEELERDGGNKDKENARLARAERFLAETIAELDISTLASKQPQPGTVKQSLREAFPAMYYEYIITAYGTAGAYEKVQELFDQYLDTEKLLPSPLKGGETPPLRLLAALMYAHLKAGRYSKVEECWKMALPRAIKLASRHNVEAWLSPVQPPAATVDGPPQPSVPGSARTSKPLVVSSPPPTAPEPEKATNILPSQRFMLSRCLSLYMRSLAYQNQAWKIPQVVEEVEKAGFALTTHTWSTYVQMLSASDRPADQFEAFTTFEEKFMPNFPGWQNLRRGYAVRPEGAPETLDEVEPPVRGRRAGVIGKRARRIWTKVQPDFMQPTYITMMYLGSALLDFRERSILDGGAELKALYEVAPKTVSAFADMPYLREKFQGVLIRRRQEQGDQFKGMEPYEHFVWTGGILGAGGQPKFVPDSHGVESQKEGSPDGSPADAGRAQEDRQQGGEVHAPVDGASATDSGADHVDDMPEDVPEPPERTLDYQDEQDMETEIILESRRRELGISHLEEDEPLDIDERRPIRRKQTQEEEEGEEEEEEEEGDEEDQIDQTGQEPDEGTWDYSDDHTAPEDESYRAAEEGEPTMELEEAEGAKTKTSNDVY